MKEVGVNNSGFSNRLRFDSFLFYIHLLNWIGAVSFLIQSPTKPSIRSQALVAGLVHVLMPQFWTSGRRN